MTSIKSPPRSRRIAKPAQTPAQSPDAAAAFDATHDDRAALEPTALITVNVDVSLAAQIALGAFSHINTYAAAIRTLPGASIALDHVVMYARAASHANAVWLHANTGPGDVQKLVAVAIPLRTRAFGVLQMFVAFGVFEQSVVDGLRSGTGYQDLAADLHVVAAMLQSHWSQLEGRTPLTLADLETMRTVAARLDEALGRKATGNVPSLTRAASDRQRAFTLLARDYDEVRRALGWLRWHEDDMDQIAPSLWLRPSSKRRSIATDVPAPTLAAPTTQTAPATPAAPAAPVGESASVKPADPPAGVTP